jgi:HD-GYP domain-containing protein (c-di-GMP phosphodiesterase class II)
VRRAGALWPEEWALIRQHPERSAELLIRAGVRSKTTLDAVRWHHEWWGGGGYPHGLQGPAISLEARMVGIADAYAALTVNRPFMAGVRGYEALMEMAQTGGQFEPRLLRAFVRTLGRALPTDARWRSPDGGGERGQGAA